MLAPLLTADAPSTLHLTSSTDNPMAPPVQLLQGAWRRVLAEIEGPGSALLLNFKQEH